MVFIISCHLHDAEQVKRFLLDNECIDKERKPFKEKERMFFSLIDNDDVREKICSLQIENGEKLHIKIEKDEGLAKRFESNTRHVSVHDVLSKTLSEEELALVHRAYDIIGSIAVIKVPEELERHETRIANAILQCHKNISTVRKLASAHEGEFRQQETVFLAGEDTTETTHVESGVRLLLDVDKVYYSPRSSHERLRVAAQVKKGERVLAMFSGCGPFAFVLAKNTDAAHIDAVEKNPVGATYAAQNKIKNKVTHVNTFEGDVYDIVPELVSTSGKYDRIIMPLPHTGHEFLDVAFAAAKKGTVVHLYHFLDEKDIPDVLHKMVSDFCEKHKHKVEFLECVKCGQFSPTVYRVCLDFKVLE